MFWGYCRFIVVLLFPALIPAFWTSSEILMFLYCFIVMFLLFCCFLWDPGLIPKRDNYDVNVCARISVIFWHPFADRAKLL
jgi:hypothetical protein